MNLILMIFFIIIGIAGLIFQVDAGVFIGFSLFPYQFIKMKINSSANDIMISIGALIGTVYFLWMKNWLLVALFLFSHALTYTAGKHMTKEDNREE